MRVIVPNTLTLLSCSLSESDAADGAEWSASATYAKGAKVRYSHVSYESLDGGNKGNRPDRTYSGENAKWKLIGATGPWRMLDDYVETQTTAQGNLSFCVPYNGADAFALLNLGGATARVRIYDESGTDDEFDYDETVELLQDIFHLSLWEYNYLPLAYIPNFMQTGLPYVYKGRLCVEIAAASETAAIGHIVVGKWHQLGYTQYGAEIGFTDYSRKSVDEFGVVTLVRRSWASRASLPVYLHPDQMDYVVQVLASLRGTPALWIGDNTTQGHSSLTVYGWLEDFRMVCEGPNENQLSLEIQGLI